MNQTNHTNHTNKDKAITIINKNSKYSKFQRISNPYICTCIMIDNWFPKCINLLGKIDSFGERSFIAVRQFKMINFKLQN